MAIGSELADAVRAERFGPAKAWPPAPSPGTRRADPAVVIAEMLRALAVGLELSTEELSTEGESEP